MKVKQTIRILLISAIVLTNIGCDQVSKGIVRENISTHEIINVIKTNFLLTKVENKGAAMSLGSNLAPQIKLVVLQIFPSLVLAFLFITVLVNVQFSAIRVWGVCFIIGGGIGNLYDRFLYGSVTDFMYMELGFLKTGVFNMADVSVFVGVILILIELIRDRDKSKSLTSLG